MSSTHRTLGVVVSLLGAGGLAGATLPAAATPSAVTACSASVFVWDGAADDTPGAVGDGRSWNDRHNWDQDCVPGLRFDTPYDDDVTIPAGASVQLSAGESATVLHLHNAGSVTVATGGWLVLQGESESRLMTVKGGLGGEGRLTVTQRLSWVSTPNGAATQTTRRCELAEVDCSTPVPPVAGRTVVAAGATMSVSGLGVNLVDSRVIEVHGKLVLSKGGYLAADDGTAVQLVRDAQSTGQLVLQNDLGVYRGTIVAGLPRAVLTNTGTILKTAGTGTSIIDATYRDTDPGSPYRGRVVVRRGTVSIWSDAATATAVTATVSQGAGLATGSCAGAVSAGNTAPCAHAVATDDNPQATDVTLTKPGTTTSTVTVEEMTAEANPGGLGVPVRIETPGAVASTSAPLVFTLRIDGSLLGGQPPAQAAQQRVVQRRPDGGAYATLPSCATSPLGGATTACVDRAASGADADDAVVVVRSLANSRYRIGG